MVDHRRGGTEEDLGKEKGARIRTKGRDPVDRGGVVHVKKVASLYVIVGDESAVVQNSRCPGNLGGAKPVESKGQTTSNEIVTVTTRLDLVDGGMLGELLVAIVQRRTSHDLTIHVVDCHGTHHSFAVWTCAQHHLPENASPRHAPSHHTYENRMKTEGGGEGVER